MKTLLKAICLFTFLGFATMSHAQKKDETVKWLTEKMMTSGFFLFHNKKFKVTDVKFDENFLIYSGSVKWEVYTKESKKTTKYEQLRTYTIDLTKTNVSNAFNSSGKNIKLNYHDIEYYKDDGKDWAIWRDSKDEYYIDKTFETINSSLEPDIIERFTKALNHYKSLMSVKKLKETF